MKASQLDRVIIIQRAVETTDAFNNPVVVGWNNLIRVRAAKEDVRASERIVAQEVGADLEMRLKVRWNSVIATVTPKDRILFEGRFYGILGIKEIGRREGRELMATSRIDFTDTVQSFDSGAGIMLNGQTGFAISAVDDSMVISGLSPYSGTPQDKLTVARAGTAYRWNSAGLWTPEAANILRRDYDPALLTPRGYLTESADTNVFTFTDDVDNAAWSKLGSTIAPNRATDIYGTTLADGEVESSGINEGHTIFRSFVWTLNVKYAVSVVVQAAGRTHGSLFCNSGLIFEIRFDLVAGTITQALGTGTIENLGGGRYRITAYGVASATISGNVQLRLASAPGVYTYVGDGVSGLNIHAFKLSSLGYETSYFPSAGAAATRVADAVTLATSLLPWTNPGLLTITGRAPRGVGVANKQVLWQADDGSENNRVRIERNLSREMHCIATVGGVVSCDLNAGVLNDNTDFTLSFGWNTDDFFASLNGGLVAADSSGALPVGLTTIRHGSSFTGEQWNGWWKTVKWLAQ